MNDGTSATECLASLPLDTGVTDMAVIEEMAHSGGGCFKLMAAAALRGDNANRPLIINFIRETWPERWSNYRNLAISRARQQTEPEQP